MPSGYINIDAETRRLIHNYNNKVYRQRKKGENVDYLRLSEYAAMPEMQQQHTLRYAEYYRKRGSERVTASGVKQYELDYANMLLNEVNQAREARRKAIRPSRKKGNIFVIERANLNPRKLTFGNEAEFKKLLVSLEKEASPLYWSEGDALYKENYFLAAERELGKENADKIREFLTDYNATDIFLLGAQNTELWIDEIYTTDKRDLADFTDTLIERWKGKLRRKKKMGVK